MQTSPKKSICILELSAYDVRNFFLKPKIYFTPDIPPYFVFDKLLNTLSTTLLTESYVNKNNTLHNDKGKKIRNHNKVNHTLYSNKDGKYDWRPLQLINPAIYVCLVHQITEGNNWGLIKDRFKAFRKNPNIECMSIPVKSLNEEKDKAAQIYEWWDKIEQRSIELALEYECLIKTDISDCYGSIYTHSIAWALHGKDQAKSNRGTNKNKKILIGNSIDGYIQDMSYGQTNGIPQGSILMDFIAEMVLGYADIELSEKIEKENLGKDYHILRYRDDYRIFVNNPQDGKKITKLLTEVLIDLGLHLNTHKTQSTCNIIKDSIKSDKLFWIKQHKHEENLQKMLLIIHNLAEKFPNSGSLTRALHEYYDVIYPLEDIKSPLPLISVVTDIAYHNPRTLSVFAAILSKLMIFVSNDKKQELLKKIQDRFSKIPNTGHLDLWLQRISGQQYVSEELLCKIVFDKQKNPVWQMAGINTPLQDIIKNTKIIDKNIRDTLPPIIHKDEFNIF